MGGSSIRSTATTGLSGGLPGTGLVQVGSGGHNDKYTYMGVWKRV